MEQPNQPQMNYDFSKASEIKCGNCESKTFKQSLMMYRMSALVSPNGQEMFLPKPVVACDQCGHVNKEFKDLQTKATT